MAIRKIPSVPFVCEIHRAEVYKFKTGPDQVIITTNLPNPDKSSPQTLSVTVQTPHGFGESWVSGMWPGIETRVLDYSAGTARGVLMRAK